MKRMDKNYWINVHYGLSLVGMNIIMSPYLSDINVVWLALYCMLVTWGGMLPYIMADKCFLVVLMRSVEKHKFLFPRIYKGGVLWFTYFLVIQYFISNIILLIWIFKI